MKTAATLLAVTVGLLLPHSVSAQVCSQGKEPDTTFPFIGLPELNNGQAEVTIYATPEARDSSYVKEGDVTDGAEKWNQACNHGHVPKFRINWTGNRPPVTPGDTGSMNYRTTMIVRLDAGFAEVGPHGVEPARWSASDNSITLFARCPTDGTHGMACLGNQPGAAIRWDLPGYLESVIAHELGHGLGLDHDRGGSGCPAGVMQGTIGEQDTGLGVLPRHCNLADKVNNPSEPCQEQPLGLGEQHPCDSEQAPFERPGGGPGGGGQGGGSAFCEEYPWTCNSRPSGGGGLVCDYACVTVSDSSGSSTSCSWGCYPATNPAGSLTNPEVRGVSPRLSVQSPSDNATVSGLVALQGWSVDITGISSITFGIDGQQIAVQNYLYGITNPAACAPRYGLTYGWCRTNSGFSATLDSRQLTNGIHELQVISTDREGWITSVEVPFFVDNATCGDSTAPSVSLTSPAAGSQVTGQVPLTATASDNVGVTHVQFLVDGSAIATDTSSPYSRTWNATSAAPGAHALAARAFDACGNSRTSAAVSVTVPAPVVPPDIAVYQDFDSVEVPIGGSSTITATTPNVATSRRFRIANLGGEPLVLSNPSSLISAPCLSLSELPTTPVPAGGVSYFRVRLLCGTPGTYSGTVSILSNDPNEANYNFTAVGTVTGSNPPPPAPDIAVYQAFDGIEVPRGGSSLINSTVINVASSRRFRIANLGNASLTISNPGSLVSGTCLSLSETPVTPVPVGGEAFFRVRLYCGTPGTYSGTVTVLSNDPDEASYSFTVSGTVTAQ